MTKEEILKLAVKPEYNNEIEIFIEGDCNDADYANTTKIISMEEFTPTYISMLGKLYEINPEDDSDDDIKEILSNEEYKLFETLRIPTDGNHSCHTIYTVTAHFLSKEDGIMYQINIGYGIDEDESN